MNQVTTSPYEYHAEKLGCRIKYLVSDSSHRNEKSLNLIRYNTLHKRIKSKTCHEQELRKGSWSYDALVEYTSLSRDWKDQLTIAFGEPNKVVKESWFTQQYTTDREAFNFYCAHRFGESNDRKLPPEVIELYTYNASVLNTVLKMKTNRKAYIRARGVMGVDMWQSLSNDVNAFQGVKHDLPTTKDSLRRKLVQYKKESYGAIISKKYGKRNAAKLKHNEQKVFIQELLKKHQNLDNEQVAGIYNLFGKSTDWKTITANTVANYRTEFDLYTHSGRRGETDFRNKKTMQVKRRPPSLPMLYWTLDGWDTELVYQKTLTNKKGHKTTTYHNRLCTVMVLDPYNKYPIGYAIGERECPSLIKEAMRNALNHSRELFGKRYKPLQLQSDNYQIKHLTPFYKAMTGAFTPARRKNAKAKVIEPYFNYFNRKHFQSKLVANWSGHNVTAEVGNQPNNDYMDKIKHQFPNEQECVQQIITAIESERSEKLVAYSTAWEEVPAEDRLPMATNEYLRWLGKTTGYTNKLTGAGVVANLEGKEYCFDSFDSNFRKHADKDWVIKYDPEDMSEVLVINAEGKLGRLVKEVDTIEFILDEKYEQPMALYDRKDGDAEELAKVNKFNKELEGEILERNTENVAVMQDLFNKNTELDTLRKLMITDSNGHHKDQKAIARNNGEVPEIVGVSALESDDFEIINNVRERY